MPQLSAVVIAGEYGLGLSEVGQEKAMISALGRPLIDYVLDALDGCREVSEVVVSVTSSTLLTEAHVRSRGYQCIIAPGVGDDVDLRQVMQLLSAPCILAVAANLPLLRPESIDDVVAAFYRSRKGSLVVGVPINEIQEIIGWPSMVMDMNGIKAMPCGIKVLERDMMLGKSCLGEDFLVTDLEDFTVRVDDIGQLRLAESILRARGVIPGN